MPTNSKQQANFRPEHEVRVEGVSFRYGPKWNLLRWNPAGLQKQLKKLRFVGGTVWLVMLTFPGGRWVQALAEFIVSVHRDLGRGFPTRQKEVLTLALLNCWHCLNCLCLHIYHRFGTHNRRCNNLLYTQFGIRLQGIPHCISNVS